MIKFFCDITGTFNSKPYENREDLLTNFITALERLSDKEISFSFCSTNDIDYVIMCVNELRERFISHKIHLDWQYGDSQKWKDDVFLPSFNNKCDQIKEDLKNSSYEKIFVADDNLIQISLSKKIITSSPGVDKSKVYSFMPQNGLSSLIDLINKYIELSEKKLNNCKI